MQTWGCGQGPVPLTHSYLSGRSLCRGQWLETKARISPQSAGPNKNEMGELEPSTIQMSEPKRYALSPFHRTSPEVSKYWIWVRAGQAQRAPARQKGLELPC